MSEALENIRKSLKAKSSKETAEFSKKVAPGSSAIYGVKMPELNKLATEFREEGFDLIEELWESGAFEEKILAMKLLERIAKKDAARSLRLVKKYSKQIDNWAVCDAMGMQALKSIVKTHQEEIFVMAEKMNSSPDMWQRRLSLVLVEWYTREPSLHPRIQKLVKALETDKEYYVKKAVQWLKRNITKKK